jgi:hypothetical protein
MSTAMAGLMVTSLPWRSTCIPPYPRGVLRYESIVAPFPSRLRGRLSDVPAETLARRWGWRPARVSESNLRGSQVAEPCEQSGAWPSNEWLTASGGRLVKTFSKVCMSLQSLRLENFLQTFCRLFLWINYFHAHFLHTFGTLSAVNDSKSADFMHTYSAVSDFLQNICKFFAENMILLCRLHAHLFCILQI